MLGVAFLDSVLQGIARAKDFPDDFGSGTEIELSGEEPPKSEPSSIEKALDVSKELWEVAWHGCLVYGLLQKGIIVLTNSMIPKAAEAILHVGLSYSAIGSMTAISAALALGLYHRYSAYIAIGASQARIILVASFAYHTFNGALAAKYGLISALAAHATYQVTCCLFQNTLANCFGSAGQWYLYRSQQKIS